MAIRTQQLKTGAASAANGTVNNASGTGPSDSPSSAYPFSAFRLVPIDGPATFPRTVTLDTGTSLLVTDPSWVHMPASSLRITPGPYLTGSAPAVGWLDQETWEVVTADDPDLDCLMPALPPKRAVDLIKTQTIFSVANQAALQQLPGIDMGFYEWAQLYVGCDAGASFDFQMGFATNSGTNNPATDIETIKAGVTTWAICKFHRNLLINNGVPVLKGAAGHYYHQGPAPSLIVPEILNTAAFSSSMAFYIILRAGLL